MSTASMGLVASTLLSSRPLAQGVDHGAREVQVLLFDTLEARLTPQGHPLLPGRQPLVGEGVDELVLDDTAGEPPQLIGAVLGDLADDERHAGEQPAKVVQQSQQLVLAQGKELLKAVERR